MSKKCHLNRVPTVVVIDIATICNLQARNTRRIQSRNTIPSRIIFKHLKRIASIERREKYAVAPTMHPLYRMLCSVSTPRGNNTVDFQLWMKSLSRLRCLEDTCMMAKGDTLCATLMPTSLSQRLEPRAWQCWLREHSVSYH